MTNQTDIAIDQCWTLTDAADSVWRISSIVKGWIEVECIEDDTENDGFQIGQTRKIRAKTLDSRRYEYVDAAGQEFWYDTEEEAEQHHVRDLAEQADLNEQADMHDEQEEEEQQDLKDQQEEATTQYTGKMAALRAARKHYVVATNASGTKTQICGDDISHILLGVSPEGISLVASRLLDKDADLYDHLNPGQVRMNWGNRIRAAIKKGQITIDMLHTAIIALADTDQADTAD